MEQNFTDIYTVQILKETCIVTIWPVIRTTSGIQVAADVFKLLLGSSVQPLAQELVLSFIADDQTTTALNMKGLSTATEALDAAAAVLSAHACRLIERRYAFA